MKNFHSSQKRYILKLCLQTEISPKKVKTHENNFRLELLAFFSSNYRNIYKKNVIDKQVERWQGIVFQEIAN